MTGGPNGQPTTYKVDMLGSVILQFKALLEEADHRGIRFRTIRTLRIIFRRLRSEPLLLGEIYRHYKNLHLLLHVAVMQDVVVHFAIHPEEKFVIVQKIFLLSH